MTDPGLYAVDLGGVLMTLGAPDAATAVQSMMARHHDDVEDALRGRVSAVIADGVDCRVRISVYLLDGARR